MSPLPSRLGRIRRPATTVALTPEQNQAEWIDCVLNMCQIAATETPPNYTAAHWTFLRKVLGFTSTEAVQAHRFRDVPLDRETCERIARDWLKCAICGKPVGDEEQRCASCAVEVAHAT